MLIIKLVFFIAVYYFTSPLLAADCSVQSLRYQGAFKTKGDEFNHDLCVEALDTVQSKMCWNNKWHCLSVIRNRATFGRTQQSQTYNRSPATELCHRLRGEPLFLTYQVHNAPKVTHVCDFKNQEIILSDNLLISLFEEISSQ